MTRMVTALGASNAVILSEVAASPGEAATQSKDPYIEQTLSEYPWNSVFNAIDSIVAIGVLRLRMHFAFAKCMLRSG